MSTLKFADATKTALSILLVPFGGSINGRDSAGEYFSAKTNLCLDWYPDRRPLLYHHGLDADAGVTPVGYIESIDVKADGAWARAQLDAHNGYYAEIVDLIDQDVLGASSGAMGHLVKKNKKTGHIDVWPLVEGSLTPTPCEPLLATVDFETAKAHFKAIGVDLPDDSHDGIKGGSFVLPSDAVEPAPQAIRDRAAHAPTADDAAYLYVAKDARVGLYRDATGTVDGALLERAIGDVRASDLPAPVKADLLARAETIAGDLGMRAVVSLNGLDATKATWTTAYVDGLADGAFLYIEPGGEKDSGGKTAPRSLRHFPYKDDAGAVDVPHLKNALARIPQSSLPADVKKRVASKARRIAGAHGIGEEAAKAVLTTLKAMDDAQDSAYDGSYEDLIEDLRTLLNPATPWATGGWTSLLTTYPDHLICSRYDPEGEQTYWHVLYSIDEAGEPQLGTATQVIQTYVPAKAHDAVGPITLDATSLTQHATAFAQRTQDLHERRIKEGRMFSAANQRMIGDTADTLAKAAADLRALVDATNKASEEAAKAAFFASPEGRARLLTLLEL